MAKIPALQKLTHMCPQTACPEYTLLHRLLFFTFQSLDPLLVQQSFHLEGNSATALISHKPPPRWVTYLLPPPSWKWWSHSQLWRNEVIGLPLTHVTPTSAQVPRLPPITLPYRLPCLVFCTCIYVFIFLYFSLRKY